MKPADEFDTVAVTVSYLEMRRWPPAGALPVGPLEITWVRQPQVSYYRYLYNTTGEPWMWWRRRVASDAELQRYLDSESTRVYVLSLSGQPHGYFELDLRPSPRIELAYFGLMPFAIGKGLGRFALNAALNAITALEPQSITVNTCTADHPAALGNYLKAGFALTGTETQEWQVPRNIGLSIPSHMR